MLSGDVDVVCTKVVMASMSSLYMLRTGVSLSHYGSACIYIPHLCIQILWGAIYFKNIV